MFKRIAISLCTLATVSTLSACGGSPDNVGACKAFIEKVKCGSVDLSQTVVCDNYKNTSCDITAYFDCLSGAYVCTNGMYDPAKLGNAATCASKATCQ